MVIELFFSIVSYIRLLCCAFWWCENSSGYGNRELNQTIPVILIYRTIAFNKGSTSIPVHHSPSLKLSIPLGTYLQYLTHPVTTQQNPPFPKWYPSHDSLWRRIVPQAIDWNKCISFNCSEFISLARLVCGEGRRKGRSKPLINRSLWKEDGYRRKETIQTTGAQDCFHWWTRENFDIIVLRRFVTTLVP